MRVTFVLILFCVFFNQTIGAQNTSCGILDFYGDQGRISSPNYPGNYFDYLNCDYTIYVNSSNTVAITFKELNTEMCCDWVQILCISGQIANSPRYSGSGLPPVFYVQSCNIIIVRLYTDKSIGAAGFSLNYQKIQRTIYGGLSIKPLHVLASNDSFAPIIFNCTSNSGYAPSWSFTSVGYTNILLTKPSCLVSKYSNNSRWLMTESFGPGSCNLIISAPPNQMQYFGGVYTCIDSTLASSSAVLIPLGLSVASNDSQTLFSGSFVRGDQLNISCSLAAYSTSSDLYSGIYRYYLLNPTLFYEFIVLKIYWSSDNEGLIPSIPISITSSYTIVTVPAEAVTSYTCNFNMSLLTSISNHDTNFPVVLSKRTYTKVLFWPEEETMIITGDTNGKILINGMLSCYVPANPQATYQWLDEANGNLINSSTIIVTHSGKFTCRASNEIRGRVYDASKFIAVQIIELPEGVNFLGIIIGISVGAGVLIIVLLIVIVILLVRAKRQTLDIKTDVDGIHQ